MTKKYPPTPSPGRAPVEMVEVELTPADCKCSWSLHSREFGEKPRWTLKYVNKACPEHRELERDFSDLARL
jgi:hypothetical protein